MATLALTVEPALAPPTGGQWFLDGVPVGTAIDLQAARQPLRTVAQQFLDLFEQQVRPFVDPAELKAIGGQLFNLAFAPVWPAVQPNLGPGPHTLILRSSDSDLLNLPWELVELHPGLPVGCDPAWALLRVPVPPVAPTALPPLDPGPIRLLFLTAAPTDEVQLDFEKEEDAMLRATGRLGKGVVVLLFAETGGIEELTDLAAEHRPHVVHLSGHGIVDRDGVGQFAFEDERGRTDLQPVDELVRRVFRGRPVRCVMLNACQSAQAAAAGLAQKLVEAGVPLVVGWAASVADDRATTFAEVFYRFLARGDTVPAAAAHARDEVWRKSRVRQGQQELVDATFALPKVYALGPGVELIDRARPLTPYHGPRTVHALLGDDVKGLTEGFIGRRRIQQELIPALREGTVTFAVLHGLGGMGKSTLATRAANRLAQDGFKIYPVKAAGGRTVAENGGTTLFKLLNALGQALLAAGNRDCYEILTDGKLPLDMRLRSAVAGLRDLRAVFVLDNFEDVLDLDTRAIADPGLREAYQVLARDLTAGSRVLVTCRYLPADTPDGQPTVWNRSVDDLSEAEFLKFLRRDTKVDERLQRGELTRSLVTRLYKLLGGTPGFLDQVRTLLRTADVDELTDDPLGEGLTLDQKRQAYYERIFLPRLYALLPPDGQRLASRLAMSELPLPPDALAGLLGKDEQAAVVAANAGVAYGLLQAFPVEELPILYHPPGLLRPWLIEEERLSTDDTRAAHSYLARFWRESYEQDREGDLRVPIDIELLACRSHAREAGDWSILCWATNQLASRLIEVSEWRQSRALLQDIPEADRDGDVWHNLASIDLHEGDYPAARERFGRALQKLHQISDKAGEADTWHRLGNIDVHESDYPAARVKLGRAFQMRQQIGDTAGEATIWHELAVIDLYEGDYPDAREKADRSLTMRRQIGDKAGEAADWHLIGAIDVNEGDYPAAREKFDRSLTMRQQIGDKAGEAATRHELGTIDAREGDYPAAREKLDRSLTMRQQIGDKAGEAADWHGLGTIDVREGDYPAAREKFGRALAIERQIGDKAGEAATWHQLGFIAWETGRMSEGMRLVALSVALRSRIGSGDAQQALENFAGMCEKLGHTPEQAQDIIRAVVQSYQQDRGRQLLLDAFPESAGSDPE
jgi:tetratricopeptide (TPR) repeat protein